MSKAGHGGSSTSHMKERQGQRGVSDANVKDALEHPLHKGEIMTDAKGRKSQKIIGKDATVVINPVTGARITTWKTGQRVRRKYGGDDAGK